jgi:replicative DNA helicase
MGNIKGPCPQVDCDSTSAFSYNPVVGVGKCHKCEGIYPNKTGEYKPDMRERYPMPSDIEGGAVYKSEVVTLAPKKPEGSLSYKSLRGISEGVMRKYGVETLTNNGVDVEQYYVYPSGSKKIRKLQEKAFHSQGSTASELFGQNLFPAGCSKKITITEGELDAMSVYQMINNNERFVNPVVSLPSSTPSGSIWDKAKPYLDSFDQIILSIDNDSNGDKVADKLNNIFPKKVLRVDHGDLKDANEFLEKGKTKEFSNLWWNASKFTPDNILSSSSDFLKLFREQQEFSYIPTGINGLDEKILGLMQGHFTVFKAPTGIGKSLAPDTPVLKYSGDVVRADEVQVGDQLMGPDSKPRNVTDVNLQRGPMYRVTPIKGASFECNADHILSLRKTGTNEVKNVTVKDYLSWSKTQKHLWKLWRTGVDFETHGGLSEDWASAYVYGCYMGDGHKQGPTFSMGKKKRPLIDALIEYGLCFLNITFDRGCYRLSFSKSSKEWGLVSDYLSERRIRKEFKTGSLDVRQHVLAGLLDTDGSCTDGGAEITQKSRVLALDICFVARSLGLAAYIKRKVVNSVTYYRVTISGDLSGLPTKRLKLRNVRRQIKNVLNTGFSVSYIGEGTYRGIMLDGDHLFLLGDFTVTHNTELMRYLEWNFIERGVTFAAWHLEETKLRTLLGLVSYDLDDNLTRKDLIMDKGRMDDVEKSIGRIADKGTFYQYFMKEDQGADELCDQIRLLAEGYGCKYIMFEPIQDVITTGSEESKESALATLSVRLSKLAADLNVGIVSIGHTNENGDFKYCKMIGQRASVIINLERDKHSEDELTRNTTELFVEKNRPNTLEGPAGSLLFDFSTFKLREI